MTEKNAGKPYDGHVVMFRSGISQPEAKGRLKEIFVHHAKGAVVREWSVPGPTFVISGADEKILSDIRKLPDVRIVEPNYIDKGSCRP